MIMRPRLRRLKPREMRSIRHWAIELAVVVVGVLLALWAAEWAEGRREAKIHAAAIEKVNIAIEEALATFAHYAATKPCIEAQRDALLTQLRDSDSRWRGIRVSNERAGISSDVAFSFPFLPLAMTYTTEPFERARSAGAFESLERNRANAYSAVESQLGFAKGFAKVFLDSYAIFAPLSVDRTITPDARLKLEQELAKADMALDAMEVVGLFVRRDLRSIGWKMSGEARASAERQVEARLQQYGECAVAVDPFPEEEDLFER